MERCKLGDYQNGLCLTVCAEETIATPCIKEDCPQYCQTPDERLEQLFSEADNIIENHPELIEEVDQEQFKRTEKLVEGMKTDDLPHPAGEISKK